MQRILLFAIASLLGLASAAAQTDRDLQAAVDRDLHAYALHDIHATVENGFVTLTGTVGSCQTRVLADRTLSGIPGVTAIWDRVQVSGPTIADRQLDAHIKRLIADRIRKLGSLRYGSISAQVQAGVVTLSGNAATELVFPSIEAIAAVPGVKNMIDHVHRVPPNSVDWPSSGPAIGISEAVPVRQTVYNSTSH